MTFPGLEFLFQEFRDFSRPAIFISRIPWLFQAWNFYFKNSMTFPGRGFLFQEFHDFSRPAIFFSRIPWLFQAWNFYFKNSVTFPGFHDLYEPCWWRRAVTYPPRRSGAAAWGGRRCWSASWCLVSARPPRGTWPWHQPWTARSASAATPSRWGALRGKSENEINARAH